MVTPKWTRALKNLHRANNIDDAQRIDHKPWCSPKSVPMGPLIHFAIKWRGGLGT